MGLITAVALIVCGMLAAAGLVVKKAPNAQQLINKLVPYQAFIGIVVACWGAWALISFVLHLGLWMHVPVYGIIFGASAAVQLLLGFLLGYGLIAKYTLSGSAEAAAKGAAMQQKLVGVQGPLGLIGIALGAVCLVLNFMY